MNGELPKVTISLDDELAHAGDIKGDGSFELLASESATVGTKLTESGALALTIRSHGLEVKSRAVRLDGEAEFAPFTRKWSADVAVEVQIEGPVELFGKLHLAPSDSS